MASSTPRPALPIKVETRLVGTGLCALSAAGFATLGILAKLAFAAGVSITGLLSLRFGGAALILIVYLTLVRPGPLFPGAKLAAILFTLGAAGYFAQSSLYFLGLARIPASISSLLLYIYPVFVAALAWLVHRQPPTRGQWLAMTLALAGVVLTVGGSRAAAQGGEAALDPLGVVFVLSSAAVYAVYIIVSDRFAHRAGSLVSTAWITAGACLSFTVSGLLLHTWTPPSSPGPVLILLGMVLFSTILPIGTFLAGMRRVGPTTASLLSTLEPVFTVLLAALVLGETLTARQAAGGALVLAAAVLLNLPHRAPG